jgi:hypothetical protein
MPTVTISSNTANAAEIERELAYAIVARASHCSKNAEQARRDRQVESEKFWQANVAILNSLRIKVLVEN